MSYLAYSLLVPIRTGRQQNETHTYAYRAFLYHKKTTAINFTLALTQFHYTLQRAQNEREAEKPNIIDKNLYYN